LGSTCRISCCRWRVRASRRITQGQTTFLRTPFHFRYARVACQKTSGTHATSHEPTMDPTIEFLWSRCTGAPVAPHDWATRLLESGHDSDGIRRLVDSNVSCQEQLRHFDVVLTELGRSDLLDDA